MGKSEMYFSCLSGVLMFLWNIHCLYYFQWPCTTVFKTVINMWTQAMVGYTPKMTVSPQTRPKPLFITLGCTQYKNTDWVTPGSCKHTVLNWHYKTMCEQTTRSDSPNSVPYSHKETKRSIMSPLNKTYILRIGVGIYRIESTFHILILQRDKNVPKQPFARYSYSTSISLVFH